MASYKKTTCSVVDSDGILGVTIGDIGWLIVMNLLVFECVLQNMAPVFSYLDEAATMVVCVFSLVRMSGRQSANGNYIPAIIATGCVLALGLLGNIANDIRQSGFAVAIDIVTCLKFPVVIIAGHTLFSERQRLYNLFLAEAKLLLVLMSCFAMVNLAVDVGMGSDVRSGIRSFQFVFTHPTYLNMAVVGFLILFGSDVKGNKVWVVLSLLLMCSTLRSKAVGFTLIFILFAFARKRNGKIPWLYFAIGAFAAIVLCWDQIQYYYTSSGFARNELASASFEVARDYAPLGSGFATFGSNVTASSEYYSPLYYRYGLSAVYGLTPGHASFVSDTFWPTVLAQFGYVGLFAYVAGIGLMFKGQRKSMSTVGIMTLYVYLLISSTSESAFFNPSAVYLALCSCLAMSSVASRCSLNSGEGCVHARANRRAH